MILTSSCSAVDRISDDGREGQQLVLAGGATGPVTLDPALVRDVESAFLARQVFRGLMQLDDNLEPQPALATNVDISADRLVYRFHLQENATFQDGSPIDAEAVVQSFNRASDPAIAGGDGSTLPAATYFDDIVGSGARLSGDADTIAGVVGLDRWTVQMTLQRPAVNFLSKMAGMPAAIVDVTTANGGDWWQHANGSGPFRIADYNPQEDLMLEAFDGYVNGRPRLDTVTVLFGTRALQPLNLYEAGDIDVTTVPSWALDRILSPNDPLHNELIEIPQLATTFIGLNPNVPPFNNPDVRRIVALAVDRQKLVDVMFDGRVQLAHGMIPPGIGDSEWQSAIPDHDPVQAHELAEHAKPMEAPIVLVEPGAGISNVVAQVLERDVGLSVDVVDEPLAEFSEQLTRRRLPAFVLTWVADYPDPENVLATLLRTGSPNNYIGYSNPAFDRLVDQAGAEADSKRRRSLYLEAQQLAIDDSVIIPLYHQVSYTLAQPWVRGLTQTEIGILSLENVWIEDDSG